MCAPTAIKAKQTASNRLARPSQVLFAFAALASDSAAITQRSHARHEAHDMLYSIPIGALDDDDTWMTVDGEEQCAVMMALVTGEHLN